MASAVTSKELTLARPFLRIAFAVPLLSVAGALWYVGTRVSMIRRFPPFTDEATYAWWALQGFQHADQRFTSLGSDVQPLAMWLGILFMHFGAGPLTAMRLVSFFAGILTLISIVAIARRVWGTPQAIVAGGLYLVLPYFVVHDAVGILDPLVVAAAMAALYLQISLAEDPRLDTSLLLGFAFAASVLTKPTGMYALLLLPFSLLLFDWSRERLARRFAAWLGYAVLALIMATLGHLITKLSAYNAPLISPNGAAPRTTRPIGQALAHPLRWIEADWGPIQHALTGYLTWPVLILAMIGLVGVLRERRRLGILLAIWAAVPIVADLLVSLEQFPRLVLESGPPLVLLAASGVLVVWRWAQRVVTDRWRLVVPVCAVLALVPALFTDGSVLASPATAHYPGRDNWQYATGWPSGAPWAPLARKLRALAGGRTIRVVLTEHVSYALQIDLREDTNISLIGPTDPDAAKADYAVLNSDTLLAVDDLASLNKQIWVWRRPRGGDTTTLLQRGVTWKGVFYSNPEALRAELNLPDAEFDAFLRSHPVISTWYHDLLG